MFKPLKDLVAVKRAEEVKQTASGLFLGNSEKINEGVVVAVGPGRHLENGTVLPVAVKVGDVVLFSKSYIEVKDEGETILLMNEDCLLAVR